MINVKLELERGGVVGVLKAAGCGHSSTLEKAVPYGKDLERYWNEHEHPGVLIALAIELGVPSVTVVQAVQVAMERLLAEFGSAAHSEVRSAMQAVEAALIDPDGVGSEQLMKAVQSGGQWLRGEQACEPWESLTVAASTGLASAAWCVMCPCGTEHGDELCRSLDGCLYAITKARMVHGEAVGRIPRGAPGNAAAEWAAGHTADAIRELIPVELLTTPRMLVPGVDESGNRSWNQRGQA